VVMSRTLSGLCFRIGARVPLLDRAIPKLEEAFGSLQELVRPSQLLVPTLLGLVAWFAECVAYFAILRGFEGVDVGMQAATFIYSVSTIAGAVFMMPGGLGVTELGMTGLVQVLSNGAVAPAAASAATILVRLATLWFAVAVGGAAYGVLRARPIRPAAPGGDPRPPPAA
jgi:glycosyltransferase 2 family protein